MKNYTVDNVKISNTGRIFFKVVNDKYLNELSLSNRENGFSDLASVFSGKFDRNLAKNKKVRKPNGYLTEFIGKIYSDVKSTVLNEKIIISNNFVDIDETRNILYQ